MIEQSSGNRWSIVWQWVVAVGVTTFLAAAAGLFGLWSLGDALEPALGEAAAYVAAGAFFGAMIGLGAAAGSAPFLQQVGVSAGRWIGATVAGGAAGMAIALPLFLVVLES
ncbi:MAG: hypothetical protein R3272_15570, partial [Candidatus Promineifilaceae bacterium]|nr:hypothetical protein [Candidatus Promineifilaceae bacterium]